MGNGSDPPKISQNAFLLHFMPLSIKIETKHFLGACQRGVKQGRPPSPPMKVVSAFFPGGRGGVGSYNSVEGRPETSEDHLSS